MMMSSLLVVLFLLPLPQQSPSAPAGDPENGKVERLCGRKPNTSSAGSVTAPPVEAASGRTSRVEG